MPVPEAMKADMETRRSELVERLSEVSGSRLPSPLPATHTDVRAIGDRCHRM